MMQLLRLIILGVFSLCSSLALAQSDFDVYDYWAKYPVPGNTLYEQLVKRSADQLSARQKEIKEKMTAEKWQSYQNMTKEKLKELVGPFPGKTDLHPVTVSTITKNDLIVEKIHFQSHPGFFVTAALFIPKNIPLPAPAILFCSGHTREGFRSSTYQHMILNYVKKGFIVFAFDPVGQGERTQYFDEQGNSYLQPTREHSYPGNQIFVTGMSPAHYFIWDGIRAIDYLISRPEVDSTRIGVTGRSGGGTQTAYIMALDERVAAAAPECYLTTYDKLLQSIGPQDAEQIIKHLLAVGLDLTDLVNVRAPKPTLMVTTTRDIFSIQGARDLYQEAKMIYELSGTPGNLQMVEDDAGHASTKKNREATYAFFQHHLNNPGSAMDEAVDTFSVEELWVTKSGNATPELGSETLFSLNQAISEKMFAEREQHPMDWPSLQHEIEILLSYEAPPDQPAIVYSGATKHEDYVMEKYLMPKQFGSPLPVIWLKPIESNGEIILILDEKGKSQQAANNSLALQLVAAGHDVILPDLSGIGELSGGYGVGDAIMQGVPINVWYASILTDKPIVALRAEEIEMVRQFIIHKTKEQKQVHMISIGSLNSDLLHAQCLGSDSKSTILIDPLLSYESLLMTKKYETKYIMSAVTGSYPIYDLPHLTHFSGDEMLVINPKNGSGINANLSVAKNNYLKYRDELNTEVVHMTDDKVNETIIKWLEKY